LSKNELTHFDKNGNPSMVDINQKDSTVRVAIATGKIIMKANTLKKILDLEIKKGDVLNVAKLAGIMAAKKTDQLIPLCHSIPLSYVNVDLEQMKEDVNEARNGLPYIFGEMKNNNGIEKISDFLISQGGL